MITHNNLLLQVVSYFGLWSSGINNIILGGCFSFSLLIIIISLLSYHDSEGIFTSYRVFAQNSSVGVDLVEVLMADSIQALNRNDVGGALGHLKLIDQQLGIRGNSVPIMTSKILVDDAIRALQNGDTNTALSHMRLANQQIGSTDASRPPVAPSISQGNLFAGGNTMNFAQNGNDLDQGNHKHPHPTSISCNQKDCLSDPGLGASTNTGANFGGRTGGGSHHDDGGSHNNSNGGGSHNNSNGGGSHNNSNGGGSHNSSHNNSNGGGSP